MSPKYLPESCILVLWFEDFFVVVIIFIYLHRQTVEIFCLNIAILKLNRNYVRRSDNTKSYSTFILLPSLLPLPSACIRPCDTNNSNECLTRMYHHTATESP